MDNEYPDKRKEKTKMLNELIQQHNFVTIFGKVEFELPAKSDVDLTSTVGLPEGKPALVSVVGAQVLGQCIKYENPVFIILPGPGIKATSCGWNDDGVKEWKVGKNSTLLTLSPETGEAQDILGDLSTLGYPKVEGYLHVRDINIHDGKLSFRIEAGANVKYHKWDKWHRYSMNHTFELEINHCVDWDFGIASLNVCGYHDRVCGEVHIVGIKIASHCEYF
jgi:hypothetical protein